MKPKSISPVRRMIFKLRTHAWSRTAASAIPGDQCWRNIYSSSPRADARSAAWTGLGGPIKKRADTLRANSGPNRACQRIDAAGEDPVIQWLRGTSPPLRHHFLGVRNRAPWVSASLLTTAPRVSIRVTRTSKARRPSFAGWPSMSSSGRCGRTRNRPNSTLAGRFSARNHTTRLRKISDFSRKAGARKPAPQPPPYSAGLSSQRPRTFAVRLSIFWASQPPRLTRGFIRLTTWT